MNASNSDVKSVDFRFGRNATAFNRLVHGLSLQHSSLSHKPGDQVLAHIEKSGRHFGMKVEASLIER